MKFTFKKTWTFIRPATLLLVVFSLFTSFLTPPALAAGETVSVWVTTADKSKLLQQQANVTFLADSGSNPTTIDVNEATTYQQMDGFGAAMTDSSAWLIYNKLSASQRTTLMNNLFGSGGARLTFVRLPMSSTDFSLSNYTYDQTCCDVNDFSVSHDTAYIIPVLQQAKGIYPGLRIIGTPWTAPTWMKDTGAWGNGKLLSNYYGAYSQYFVKFAQAYQGYGLPIYAVTLQNEPHHEPGSYPGMRMEPVDQANFVKNNLGPAFVSAGLNTKIVVWDHNWDETYFPIEVLNDSAAKAYIYGSAFHCYAGAVGNQNLVQEAHPSKAILFTECSGGAWATNFGDNLKWNMQNIVIGNTRAWGNSVLLWNMALDTNYGPISGGCTNCRGVVTINQSNGAVTYNEEYYTLAHISRFVDPGAYRIASNTFAGNIENVAFKNPDGSKVLLALNAGAASKTFRVRWAGQYFDYTLPAGAVATFKWSNASGPTNTPVPPTATPTTANRNPYIQTEAESFDVNSGLQTETTSDTGGGLNVGWADSNDYLRFNRMDFGSGAGSVQARVASTTNIGRIEFRLDSPTGPLAGTLNIPNTGGWQTWTTSTVNVSGASGVHDLYLVYQGGSGLGNLNWFKFVTGSGPTNTPVPPTATPTQVPPTATPSGSVYYQIVSRHSSKALDMQNASISDGALLTQWTYGGGANQQFQFVPVAGTSYYQIVARHSGKCLDVQNGSSANGALIQQWACSSGNTNQHFSLQTVAGTSYVRIIARVSNKCLDVQNVSTADGALIQQWACGSGANQQWLRTVVP